MQSTIGGWILALAGLGGLAFAQGDPSAPVFDGTVLHDVEVTMSPADLVEMLDRYTESTRYRCTFRWGAETVPNCSINVRGAGSRIPEKPGLLIKFGEYGPPNHFRTLRGVILENLAQDSAMMKERLEWEIAALRGMATPRVSHTRLHINGASYGLYTLDERVDKAFLRNRWGEDTGNLYRDEYDWARTFAYEWRGPEPSNYVPRLFKPETNVDPHDPSALLQYLRDVNFATDDAFEAEVGRSLDWNNFLDMMSIEASCSEADGFAGDWSVHNYFVYHLQRDRKFRYILWDRDYSFWDANRNLFQDWNLHVDPIVNVLLHRTYTTPSLRARYLTKCGDQLSRWVNEAWFVQRVDAIYAQIRAAAYADTRKPYSNQEFEDAVAHMRAWPRARGASMRRQLAAEVTEREVTAGLGQGGQDHLYTWRTSTTDPPAPQLYQLAWAPYDTTVGETHPAYGDVDGDGLDEMVVGFGSFPSNGGWVQVRDDAEHGTALLGWLRVPDSGYNATNGATYPACGDTDGDGRAEIAVGLGRGGRGWWYVFDDAIDLFALRASRQVPWSEYNDGPGGGETRLALGDIDLDGRAEPVIGLGPGGQGRWLTFSDAASDYQFRTWNQVEWPEYNTNRAGTTRPAVGDIDADGLAEVIIGLEQGGECRLEVFDDAWSGHAHMEWLQVGEEPYRASVGATRPALADMDADGDADLAVGFARGGQGKVEVWRRSTATGQYVPWWTRRVPGPGGYAAANGETWPSLGIRRWAR